MSRSHEVGQIRGFYYLNPGVVDLGVPFNDALQAVLIRVPQKQTAALPFRRLAVVTSNDSCTIDVSLRDGTPLQVEDFDRRHVLPVVLQNPVEQLTFQHLEDGVGWYIATPNVEVTDANRPSLQAFGRIVARFAFLKQQTVTAQAA